MEIRPQIAVDVQLDKDFTCRIVGENCGSYTGAEKCLMVPHLTDDALFENIQVALRMTQVVPFSIVHPPETTSEDLQLLLVEVFMRYQRVIREKK